jgi:hypothetical protein
MEAYHNEEHLYSLSLVEIENGDNVSYVLHKEAFVLFSYPSFLTLSIHYVFLDYKVLVYIQGFEIELSGWKSLIKIGNQVILLSSFHGKQA